METKTKYALAAVLIVVIIVVGGVAWALLPSQNSSNKVIKFTTVAPVNQEAAIANGQVAGAIGWEPYPSAAVLDGKAHVLIWSDEIWPDHPCCVIVANSNFAAENPETVKNFLAADIAAYKWIQDAIAHPDGENYSHLLQLGATFANVSPEAVNDTIAHTPFTYEMDSAFQQGLVNFTKDFIDLDQTSTAKLNAAGYSSVESFIDSYIDDSYLNDALSVAPSNPATLVDVHVGFLTGDLHQLVRLVAADPTAGGGKSLFNQYGINPISSTGTNAGYSAGPAEMLAFQAGQVDIGYLGAPPAILYKINSNTPTVIIAGENTEGSALIVSNDIQSIDDLNGKVIADPGPGSIQHLLLQAIAEKYGYKLQAA